jgi:hypothetical protein
MKKVLELLGFFFEESKGALYSCQVDTGMKVMLQRLSRANVCKNTTMAAGPLRTNWYHAATIASIIFATKLMFVGKR